MSLLDKIKKDVSEEETQTVDQQVTESLTKEERKALKKAKRTGFTETIEDDYDDSDRTLADSDAHRDMVYSPPSWVRQMIICYMTQMKRFTKERSIWLMLILLALIPILYLVATKLIGVPTSHVTNIFMSVPLFAMPVISMFICSSTCGTMLPREYNERTIYLTLPLPMSRSAFYLGKFLAGFTLCTGVITAAYGISILMALTIGNTDVSYTGAIFTSLLIMVCTTFFLCSFVYMLSAVSKRGATLKALVLLVVALPGIVVLFNALPSVESLQSFKGPLEAIAGAFLYLPVLGPDLAINHLGASGISEYFMMDYLSVGSFGKMAFGMKLGMDTVIMCLVAIVLGALCLYRGFVKIRRRDM